MLFLHSYANVGARTRAWSSCCAKRCPSAFITASHHVSREQREYERTSTVAANAYVGPRVSTYLERLERHLESDGFTGNLLIMQSSGGLCDVATAREQCIQMLESGPAAGVVASKTVSESLGIGNLICFDMGGTTAKACVLQAGAAALSSDYFIGGYNEGLAIRIPVLDIKEIGTGGGSIASVDDAGGLHVGPQSAGAKPGPRLLRRRRHAADRHRRPLGARPPRARPLPRRTDATRRRGRDARGSNARRDAARTRRRARGGRHHRDRDRGDGERGARGNDRARPRSARLRAGRLRRRGPAARGRRGARTRDRDGRHPAGTGHVLGLRHADRRSAPRVRANLPRGADAPRVCAAPPPSSRRSRRRRERGCDRPGCRTRTRCSNTRSTCATSARTIRSRSRSNRTPNTRP